MMAQEDCQDHLALQDLLARVVKRENLALKDHLGLMDQEQCRDLVVSPGLRVL